MNAKHIIDDLMAYDNSTGTKAKKVRDYCQLLDQGKISDSEFRELLEDLCRIDSVDAAADQIDQQLLLKQAVALLLALRPLAK